MERLAARGVELLVTVDCGVTAVEQVAAARAAGLDVVITDHHRPGPALPDCTLVHPALGAYGCPELCAAGVVLKLSEALQVAAGADPQRADEDLDLAALATVCDLVPLRDENRRIVREGLVAMARTRKPGLRALMALASVEPAELTEQHLGFRLGPRINAAGRMRRADAALELLLTEDEERAKEVARELDLLTATAVRPRRALRSPPRRPAPPRRPRGHGGGRGGLAPGSGGDRGLAAGRALAPALRGDRLEDGAGRGSGRSISPYDLHAGLAACAEHLIRFGGHRMAAGVELEAGAVEPFGRALATHAGHALTPGDLIPRERVDAVVPAGCSAWSCRRAGMPAPFGMGNPQPTLLVPAARFQHVAAMGEEKQHSRFTLVTAGGARSRGVAFGSAPRALAQAQADNHDIALRLERNRWNGMVEPRVLLRAMCPTLAGSLDVLGEEGTFWERLAGELGDGSAPAEVTRIEDSGAGPEPIDRSCEGFAGVAGDLFTSGEPVLVGWPTLPGGGRVSSRSLPGWRRRRCPWRPGTRSRRPRPSPAPSGISSRSIPHPAAAPIRCCARAHAPTSPGGRPRPSSPCSCIGRARPQAGAGRRLPRASRP